MSHKDHFIMRYGSSQDLHGLIDSGEIEGRGLYGITKRLPTNVNYDRSHVDKLLLHDNGQMRSLPFHVQKHITAEDMDRHIHDPHVGVRMAVINQSWNPEHYASVLRNPKLDEHNVAHVVSTAERRGILNHEHIALVKQRPEEWLREFADIKAEKL